jgi:hypothetical protein
MVEQVPEDGADAGDGSTGQTISLREPACHWYERKEAHAEQPAGEESEEDLRGVSVQVAHG